MTTARINSRQLGTTDITLPTVGMGTRHTFDVSGRDAQAACRDLVTTAMQHGTTVFDTSPMFDESERVLGATLTARRSHAFVISGVWAWEARDGLRQIGRSLHLFDGTIDLVQVLNAVHWEAYVQPFRHMRSVGETQATGVSAEELRDLPELLRAMRSRAFDSVQIPLNPLQRTFAAQVLPLAGELELGVCAIQPFGSGALLASAPPPHELRRFQRFHCTTWAQVLLKWVLSDPRVTVVLPASSNPEHIAENAAIGRPPWFSREERLAVVALAERYCGQAATSRTR